MKKKEFIIKIASSGEGRVGKTSLLDRYVNSRFDNEYKNTIGVDIFKKIINHDSNKHILILWDFGGQDRFRFFLKDWINGASGALFMFDLTRIETLEAINEWMPILRNYNKTLPILLIGTKLDLIDYDKFPYIPYIHRIMKKYNIFNYQLTSAKDNIHVDKAIYLLFEKILQDL